jgi:4'-phosphopantetheinyl transferase
LPRDARGRPQLADVLPGWDVNWSHGGGRLLAVLGQGLDVGCDVEAAARRFRQASALAQRYFDAATAAAIAALPAADQADAALRQWVVREAVLKAHGQGLAFGLHRLQATWDSAGPRLVACDVALGAPEAWTLHAVDVPACLAVVALREHCA